jgi:bifunctional UDP-N-acetylglucosamine pyrophosphorylase/glucosamine-1-phosphate N-acetyltransferase
MTSSTIQAIILAAGRSSRFGTESTKLAANLCGQPMVAYPARLCKQLGFAVTCIVGYQKEIVQSLVSAALESEAVFIAQDTPRGTGHALLCSAQDWSADYILVMNGDMPLVSQEIIKSLIKRQQETDAAVAFVTAYNADPAITSYGKVVTQEGKIRIIEAKDAQDDLSLQAQVNAGIYLFKRSFLEEYKDKLTPSKVTGELYITDFIELASNAGLTVVTVTAPFDYVRGINTLKELWVAEHILRSQLIAYWMERGVRFSFPQTVHLDTAVTLGAGTFIGAGVELRGKTTIGQACIIDSFTLITSSTLHDSVQVLGHTVIHDSLIEQEAQVGPFAHIKNQAVIGKKAVIGNFVEVTKSTIGHKTKAKHLAYISTATVGDSVNIGAGTITCNYNGVSKHATIIHDGAQIGSNNCLVAPVTLGKNCMTAAGSVITQDVPEESLALARARQENKIGYVPGLKARLKERAGK